MREYPILYVCPHPLTPFPKKEKRNRIQSPSPVWERDAPNRDAFPLSDWGRWFRRRLSHAASDFLGWRYA